MEAMLVCFIPNISELIGFYKVVFLLQGMINLLEKTSTESTINIYYSPYL